ncbi:MAG: type II secretion system major pseudopilin GspG [Spirochaetia bacterium]|nr:type II secretion system major pseudopilin GspG [Spirochaetia bacterium]
MKNIKEKLTEFIKDDEGWTFMETLVVIAVILILTATAGFACINSLEKARSAAAKTQIESFAAALEAYYIDCGNYPTQEQGLSALRKKPETSPYSDIWSGPYIYKDAPKDPWGFEYEYTSPAPDGSSYGIRSFGADGLEGGEGRNADIKSWE